MKFGQIKDSLMVLLNDAIEAEDFLDAKPKSQFARRTYIRTFFSYMEGAIWILKKVCFNAKPNSGMRTMTVAEFSLLREESYELKNNGDTKTSTRFLRFPDNMKFTFKTINKLFNSNIDLEVGKNNWNEFIQASEIRNRITHPKKVDSLNVTDKEIETCKQACNWFNDLCAESIKAFFKNSSSQETK